LIILHNCLQSFKNVFSLGDFEAKVIGLNKGLLDFTILNDGSVSLGSSVTKKLASLINKRTKLLGKGTRSVSNKADMGSIGVIAKLLAPGLGYKSVIDGNNKNVGDTLGLELLAKLNVTRSMRSRACGRKGSRNTNNNRLALCFFVELARQCVCKKVNWALMQHDPESRVLELHQDQVKK
jgi:hypothetical protein